MLELNCTYEESKKILELGYDFSEVCTFFTDGNPNYVKINEGLYLPTYADVCDGVINGGIYAGSLPAGSVPLIPKAALEECLPRNLNAYPFSSHLVRKLEKFGYRRNGKEYSYINFDSAFEAFLWCHENYPEELKVKFDEVMV